MAVKKKSAEEPSWGEIGKSIGSKMEKECKDEKWKGWNIKHVHNHAGGGVYGLGFIGALVYYISTATGFWMGVLGVLKAIVWPAFLVYGLLKSLGM
jgi:hypothetical protein